MSHIARELQFRNSETEHVWMQYNNICMYYSAKLSVQQKGVYLLVTFVARLLANQLATYM